MNPQVHHSTRVIHYPCEYNHVVEYYHTSPNCNRSNYVQGQPCVNTPNRTDNPNKLKATHYRLPQYSVADTKGIRAGGTECPVCRREVWKSIDQSRVCGGGESGAGRGGSDATSAPERSSWLSVVLEGGPGEIDGGGGGNDVQMPDAESKSWLLEMPFLNIWERRRGKLVDTRPYKYTLPGATHNRHKQKYGWGGYKGINN